MDISLDNDVVTMLIMTNSQSLLHGIFPCVNPCHIGGKLDVYVPLYKIKENWKMKLVLLLIFTDSNWVSTSKNEYMHF